MSEAREAGVGLLKHSTLGEEGRLGAGFPSSRSGAARAVRVLARGRRMGSVAVCSPGFC